MRAIFRPYSTMYGMPGSAASTVLLRTSVALVLLSTCYSLNAVNTTEAVSGAQDAVFRTGVGKAATLGGPAPVAAVLTGSQTAGVRRGLLDGEGPTAATAAVPTAPAVVFRLHRLFTSGCVLARTGGSQVRVSTNHLLPPPFNLLTQVDACNVHTNVTFKAFLHTEHARHTFLLGMDCRPSAGV